MFFYVLIALVMFGAIVLINQHMPVWAALALNTLILLVFIAIAVKRDLPLESLPVIGKRFKSKNIEE